MKYKYAVLNIKPEILQNSLIKYGSEGWELVTIILLQLIKPGLAVNGHPNLELQYQLIFKQPFNGPDDNID